MSRLFCFTRSIVVLEIVLFAGIALGATTLEDITVMALGPLDGRAVVKLADEKMQVLNIGDTIPGTKLVVTQVLTDKLVVEDTIEKLDKTQVKQTVWILKPTKAGGKSPVQRLDRDGPAKELILKPVIQEIEVKNK